MQGCGDAYLTLEDTAWEVGPIHREGRWVATFVAALEASRRVGSAPQEWVRPVLEAAPQNRPAACTHGDLHMGNIMVTRAGRRDH